MAHINHHARCAGCGYDLFKLQLKGMCPECGRPVRLSVMVTSLNSDGLDDPAWAKRVFRGLLLITLDDVLSIGVIGAAIAYVVTGLQTALGLLLSALLVVLIPVHLLGSRLLWTTPTRLPPLLPTHRLRRLLALDSIAALGLALIAASPWLEFSPSRHAGFAAIAATSFFLLAIATPRFVPFYAGLRELEDRLAGRSQRRGDARPPLVTLLGAVKVLADLWLTVSVCGWAVSLRSHWALPFMVSTVAALLAYGFVALPTTMLHLALVNAIAEVPRDERPLPEETAPTQYDKG